MAFTLDEAGAQQMRQLSEANIGKPMAILLHGEVIAAPNLQDRISSRAQITFGPRTDEEQAKQIVEQLEQAVQREAVDNGHEKGKDEGADGALRLSDHPMDEPAQHPAVAHETG